jgi:uncharacterized protein (DUF433 family)
MRIPVVDILDWIDAGMTIHEILAGSDELEEKNIYASLSDCKEITYSFYSHCLYSKLQ